MENNYNMDDISQIFQKIMKFYNLETYGDLSKKLDINQSTIYMQIKRNHCDLQKIIPFIPELSIDNLLFNIGYQTKELLIANSELRITKVVKEPFSPYLDFDSPEFKLRLENEKLRGQIEAMHEMYKIFGK